MPNSLVTKVKTKIFVTSSRKAVNILDGSYSALTHGRSLDFDDLREYQKGDNTKDIDWKSTARSNKTLVRRYVANKQIPLYLIVDSGKSMNALTSTGETRKDVGLMAAGVLGYIAIKHGDSVGCIYGDIEKSFLLPTKSTESNLEFILQNIKNYTEKTENKSDIFKQIKYILTQKISRSIVVVIAGDIVVNDISEQLMLQLHAKHDVVWVSTRDGNPLVLLNNIKTKGVIVDIETNEYVPDYIKNNKKLNQMFTKREVERINTVENFLEKINISTIGIDSEDIVVINMVNLLQRRLTWT